MDARDRRISETLGLGQAHPGLDTDPLGPMIKAKVLASLFEEVEALHIDRFEVRRLIGSGAMGTVFEAWDTELERAVALKVLHANTGARPWLEREARSLAKIRDPRVVTVYEVVDDGERLCLVLELMTGETLRAWLLEPRSLGEVLEVFADLSGGLAAVHAARLVHRDFKPDNVIFNERGAAKVSDFGLARSLGPSVQARGPKAGGAEASGVQTGFAGTPAYAAPEQLRGETVSAAADVFALCRSLHEALYGKLPPRERAQVPRRAGPRRGGARIPRALRRMIEAGLSSAPEARPSAAEVELLLTSHARRRPQLLVTVLALSCAGIGAGAWLGLRADPSDPCQSHAAAFESIWNEDRAELVRARFDASGQPYTEVLATSLIDALSDYAQAWTAGRIAVCHATRSLDDPGLAAPGPGASVDARARCFADAARQTDMLVTKLERADPSAIERALAAVEALPAIETCAQLDTNAPLRPKLASIEALERAQLAIHLGDIEAALDHSQALLTPAEPDALRAAAQLVRGRALTERGQLDAALDALRDAWWLALRLDDDTAASAAVEIARIHSSRRQDYEHAREWLEHARAQTRSDDPSVELEIELERTYVDVLAGGVEIDEHQLSRSIEDQSVSASLRLRAQLVLGYAQLYRGRPHEAVATFRALLGLTRARHGDRHPANAEAMAGLLTSLRSTNAPIEQRSALLDELEEILGAATRRDPLLTSWVGQLRADQHRAVGDFARAAAKRRELLAELERQRPLPAGAAAVLMNLAHELWRLGETEQALRQLERAEQLTIQVHGPDDFQVAQILNQRAEIFASEAAWEACLATLEQTRDIYRVALPATEHADVVNLRRAYPLIQLGRLDEAEAVLGFEPSNPAPIEAEVLSARAALAIARGGHGHGRELLAKLVEELGAPGESPDETAELWLRIIELEAKAGDQGAAKAHATALLDAPRLAPSAEARIHAWLARHS